MVFHKLRDTLKIVVKRVSSDVTPRHNGFYRDFIDGRLFQNLLECLNDCRFCPLHGDPPFPEKGKVAAAAPMQYLVEL